MTADITDADDIMNAGSVQVYVHTGGANSNAMSFTITRNDAAMAAAMGPELEMRLQIGEPLHHQQSLVWRSGGQVFVLQNPGVVMRDEDGVQAGGERRD